MTSPPNNKSYLTMDAETLTPHSSWAAVYDLAYEQTHGNYESLLSSTVQEIQEWVKPPASVVDFGAGTGRIAIPLANKGFDVVAVESCVDMLHQLELKSTTKDIETVHCKIQNFHHDRQFDMALCVFTVIAYLLDKNSLVASINSMSSALKPGGFLLIDIPKRSVFRSYQRKTSKVDRSVKLSQVNDGDLYEYSEKLIDKTSDSDTVYTDIFNIRFWNLDEVMRVMNDSSLVMEQELTERFPSAGSQYLLMRKI